MINYLKSLIYKDYKKKLLRKVVRISWKVMKSKIVQVFFTFILIFSTFQLLSKRFLIAYPYKIRVLIDLQVIQVFST